MPYKWKRPRSLGELFNASFDHTNRVLKIVPYGYTGSEYSVLPAAATTPTVYNITMTSADTEYSQALPDNTKSITFQCRGDYDIRFAFVTNKVATPTAPYMTLKAGQNYFENKINLSSKTLYLACATASQITEIICWT